MRVIVFRHWSCLAKVKVPAEYGGHKVPCPKCGDPVQVPLSELQKAEAAVEKAKAQDLRAQARGIASAARWKAAEARRREREAAALDMPPPLPAAPRRHSPLEWGFGIGCGLILVYVLFTALVWGGCAACAVAAFK